MITTFDAFNFCLPFGFISRSTVRNQFSLFGLLDAHYAIFFSSLAVIYTNEDTTVMECWLDVPYRNYIRALIRVQKKNDRNPHRLEGLFGYKRERMVEGDSEQQK